ncbi:hypothetical protein [Epilithonimonas hispanica]|uniref:Uncharacterized protein n=1 Tax=Epilithonimonas hispanica TaxID=358687 RepID=A0A3D9D0F2_9FLAO|nr:hypothetical protein [Epilithonimonas hispanica]REC71388.1 hypothetical protein DRF58_06110 [Epilithonimonas hispanica]
MAKVDINIIKEWFRNLKKPNQDQFWSWLDSFRHKDEKIPMADVENLTQTLTKKADLINGIVPESQLPFTLNSNEVVTIGEITTTANQVNIGVHESGSNKVRIGGQILSRSFPNNLPYTAVTDGNKFLRIIARNETGLFFLKESAESDEPLEPALDDGEVHVRLILVTPEGNYIDPEILSGFKEKQEDNWKKVPAPKFGNYIINYNDTRTFFSLENGNLGMGISVVFQFGAETDRDIVLTVRNNNSTDLLIPQSATNRLTKGLAEDFTLKAGLTAFFKYNVEKDILEVLKVSDGSGSASFPESSENGLALVSDNTSEDKVKWYNGFLDKLITTAQSVASFVTFSGNFRAKRHYFSVDEAPDTSPLKIWTDGIKLFFTNNSGVNKQLSVGSVFVYTPTGNFTISAIKTAMEAQGIIFNDSHIIVNLGTNNYTCSIDIGASNPNTIFTIGKRGTGSVSFSSIRTLNSGSEGITIFNGNEASMAKIELGTSVDFLTIVNL